MKRALTVIEKCSIKRIAQISLIQFGLVPWILRVLRIHKQLDLYTLEYITALLMNLVTRVEGRKACLDPDLEALNTLVSLIENPNVRTYVGGTLYSLLALPEFKSEAKVWFRFN
jgi:hypothetical protein